MGGIKQNIEGNMRIMRFMGNTEITLSVDIAKINQNKISKLIFKLACPKSHRHQTSNF